MTRKTTDGGALAGAPAVENITPATAKSQDRPQRTATTVAPIVAAVRLLAVAGALRDRAIVRRCPWCLHAHVHVVYEAGVDSFERSPRCHPRRRYIVRIVDVLPTGVVGGHRRREAA